jgi:hypothetical protein
MLSENVTSVPEKNVQSFSKGEGLIVTTVKETPEAVQGDHLFVVQRREVRWHPVPGRVEMHRHVD